MPSQFDKLVKAVKAQLKKDNPEMDGDKLDKKAIAVATSQYKKKYGKSPSSESSSTRKLDEKGRIIIGENVKMLMEGTIVSLTE